MDLHFTRFEPQGELTILPPDLAVLMVDVSARQAASPTAALWGRMNAFAAASSLLAPAHGSFNDAVAARIASWEV